MEFLPVAILAIVMMFIFGLFESRKAKALKESVDKLEIASKLTHEQVEQLSDTSDRLQLQSDLMSQSQQAGE